jgi:3-hydroxybutyryl-CoA dehydrogenase
MKLDDIRHVFVIGSGTMGRKIALRCAVEGYSVTVYEAFPEALKNAPEQMRNEATEQVREKRLTAEASKAALARIHFTNNPQDAATADLISESVPEDPEVKAKVFAKFAEVCPPRTIFTTNTSTLAPSLYANATGRPDRFAALHFYGVWPGCANLVDVMPHPGTSAETIALLRGFAKKIGQVPMMFKFEFPCYVGNSFAAIVNGAAFRLWTSGSASFEDIDRAAVGILKMGLGGPFARFDVNGLDFLLSSVQRAAQAGDTHSQLAADWLKKDYVDKGRLGKKSGQGFYTYPNPAFEEPGFLEFDEERLRSVANALAAPMNNGALKVATRGVASFEDVDRAAMVIYGMPKGPFGIFDSEGLESTWQWAEEYASKTGDPEDRTIADWLKKEYVDKGLLGEESGRGFYTYPNPAYSRPDFLTGGEDADAAKLGDELV